MKTPGKLIKIDHANRIHRRTLHVGWALSNACNYACAYCPENLRNHSFGFPDLDEARSFCDSLFKQRGAERIAFELTGGEVTLWKDFLPFLEYLHERQAIVTFQSNGSRPLSFWKDVKPYADHILLTFHAERADPEYFNRVAELLSDQVDVQVNIAMDPKNFDWCLKTGVMLSKLPDVRVALQPLTKDLSGPMLDYGPEQLEVLLTQYAILAPTVYTRKSREQRGWMIGKFSDGTRKQVTSHELTASQSNRWYGWKCSAGLEQISIGFDGMIYKGWCRTGGQIGNFRDRGFVLPKKPTFCDVPVCACGADMMCTKSQPSWVRKATGLLKRFGQTKFDS